MIDDNGEVSIVSENQFRSYDEGPPVSTWLIVFEQRCNVFLH